MRRRLTKSTFTISKASLSSLENKEKELVAQVSDYRKKILSSFVLSTLKKKFHHIDSEISILRNETILLRSRTVNAKGLVSKIFNIQEVPETSLAKIKANEHRINTISPELEKVKTKLNEHAYYKNRILDLENLLLKIKNRIRQLHDKRDLINSLKNKAAETTKDKRVIGESIKRVLHRNKNCPYCGIILNATAHADHIYPISKGGESTIKNMVWVCVKCNSQKSDLTLQAFIRKFHLNRESIEKRLTDLKKEF
jgi:5-methylcytosine-specific restriction endonuclease McrA